MMNPTMLFKMKGMWDRFTAGHPKFPLFLKAVQQKGIREGTILAMSVTTPSGEKIETNLKLSAEDMALFEELKQLQLEDAGRPWACLHRQACPFTEKRTG